MAVAENLNVGRRQLISAWQKISSDSLGVRPDKGTTWDKGLAEEIVRAGGFGVTQRMRDSMQLLAYGAVGSTIGFRGLHL